MKTIACLFMLWIPAVCMCQYTYQNLSVNFLENADAAKNYTFENLRLYPVYAKQTFVKAFAEVGKYIPLTEALKKNKVKITEQKDGGQVNSLVIENTSADTILVVTGDVVKGGKQDRIIQKDMLLIPKTGKKKLEVFCVESGRWQGRTTTSRADEAEDFKVPFNKGSVGLRKVVEKNKTQGAVWDKVEKINQENKTTTSTKTYTAINNSADYNKKLNAYLQYFSNKFNADSNIIGVVVVTGNRVLACDMFATPALFKSQYQSLLHSYVTEVILDGKPVTVTTATVKNYMNQLLGSEQVQQATLTQKGNAFIEKGKKLRVSSFD